jgi:hypothetical protein
MIKFLKKLAKLFLLKLNINLYLFSSKEDILKFISLFNIKLPKNINLIRIGSNNDGGYLVPNILDKISYCYSLGIGKNVSFENDLYKKGISSFGADGNINKLPENIKNYNFINKNIGLIDDDKNLRFETMVNSNTPDDNSLIAQIDIEGEEYSLLMDTPLKILEKFKVIIIEFHNLNKISDKIIYNFYSKSLQKILLKFNICHMHINNAEQPIKIKNIYVPPLIEITFLRKDFYNGDLQQVVIPNNLDEKNVVKNSEIKFDKNWTSNFV